MINQREQFEYSIEDHEIDQIDRAWSSYVNLPVVYLMYGSQKIYIGETTNVKKRFKQHQKNEEKRIFKQSKVIWSSYFNKSATYDIEAKLMNYFFAEDRLEVQNIMNMKKGLAIPSHTYYQQENYNEMFKDIWSDLIEQGLAKEQMSIIETSELFKLSPFKQLSEEQSEYVEDICSKIANNETGEYVVSGDPGTGKSLLLTYLFFQLFSYKKETGKDDFKIAIVIPQGNLKSIYIKILQKMLSHFNNGKRVTKKEILDKYLLTPASIWKRKEMYDVIICDEAHRLKELFNKQIKDLSHLSESGMNEAEILEKYSKHKIFLYDSNQTIRPADVSQYFEEKAKTEINKYYLTEQFRVACGTKYITMIKDLLQIGIINTSETYDLGDYKFQVFDQLSDMVQTTKNENTSKKIARLGAGYAYKWVSNRNKNLFDIIIDDTNLKWNSNLNGWHNSRNAENEVGCIHTLQGVDLNCAGIIIGKDLYFNKETGMIDIDITNYHDRNGKPILEGGKLTPEKKEELKRYIKNIYFVLLTRGIDATYLYIEDDDLRNYVKDFIEKKVTFGEHYKKML